jgi:hypothetical protein
MPPGTVKKPTTRKKTKKMQIITSNDGKDEEGEVLETNEKPNNNRSKSIWKRNI